MTKVIITICLAKKLFELIVCCRLWSHCASDCDFELFLFAEMIFPLKEISFTKFLSYFCVNRKWQFHRGRTDISMSDIHMR